MARYPTLCCLATIVTLVVDTSGAQAQGCAMDAPLASITTSNPVRSFALSETHHYSNGIPVPFVPAFLVHNDSDDVYVRSPDTLLAHDNLPSAGPGMLHAPIQKLDDGATVLTAARSDGVVTRLDFDPFAAGGMAVEWSADTRRPGCPADTIAMEPAVHLRALSDAAFLSTFSHDLVFAGTDYDSGCPGYAVDNRVYAFDAADGTAEWVFNSGGTYDVDAIQGLAIDTFRSGSGQLQQDEQRNTLFVTTEQRASSAQDSLWSIDVLTGTVNWSVNAGRIQTRPLVSDDRLYVANLAGQLKAIDKTDGSEIWSVSVGGLPIVGNMTAGRLAPWASHIALVNYYGQVYLVRDNGANATVLWATSPYNPVAVSDPLLDDLNGYVYVGALDGKLYQLDIASGALGPTRNVDTVAGTIGLLQRQWPAQGGDTPFSLVAGSSGGTIARFCAPFMSPPGTYVADGDVNVDGSVDVRDVLLGTQVALGNKLLNPEQFGHGDVAPLMSGVPAPDGDFGLPDVLLIARKALGLAGF